MQVNKQFQHNTHEGTAKYFVYSKGKQFIMAGTTWEIATFIKHIKNKTTPMHMIQVYVNQVRDLLNRTAYGYTIRSTKMKEPI
jgi:hypothetical protein